MVHTRSATASVTNTDVSGLTSSIAAGVPGIISALPSTVAVGGAGNTQVAPSSTRYVDESFDSVQSRFLNIALMTYSPVTNESFLVPRVNHHWVTESNIDVRKFSGKSLNDWFSLELTPEVKKEYRESLRNIKNGLVFSCFKVVLNNTDGHPIYNVATGRLASIQCKFAVVHNLEKSNNVFQDS
jgi:hypothetical protein